MVGSLAATAGLLILLALAMQQGDRRRRHPRRVVGLLVRRGRGHDRRQHHVPELHGDGVDREPLIVLLIGLGSS